MFTLGDNIKKLRRGKELTQETLAEMLHITPQAVSRWETNVTSPEAALLPKLAYIFDCTTDELLGVSRFNRDEKFEEYDKQAFALSSKGEGKAVVELWRRALDEMPGDCAVMAELAHQLRFIADNTTDEGMAMFREARILYEAVLDRCTDPDIVNKTRRCLPAVYKYLGEQEKAVAVAEQLPSIWHSRELVKREIAGNDENRINEELIFLGFILGNLDTVFRYFETNLLSDEDSGELMKKHAAIDRILYDGDEREMNDDLRLRLAKWLCSHGETEEGFKYLRTGAEMAKWKDESNFKNGGYARIANALPFRYSPQKYTTNFMSSDPFTFCGIMREKLTDPAYDSVRNTPEFKEIEAIIA